MAQRTEKIHEVPIQQIDVHTDTREILANARQQAEERNYQDYVIFDVDAHHIETVHWGEICEYIEDPVIRSQAVTSQKANPYGLIGDRGMTYQDVGGRIPHDTARNETVEETDVHRDVVLTRRAMESMGLDYQVVFPTPMLSLGTHPQLHMEVLLGRAHNRWMVENLLKADNRIKSMLYLPISDPVASLKVIEEFGEEPGVIGFMVTSVRNKAIQENQYMKVYAALEERGLPLAFHGGYYWHEPAMALFNQFVGMHCVAFVLWNLVHLVNWVLNGLPERFPKLKVIWLESGLSWIPFIMQRLDSEYMLRSSEAPALKRLPSEYIREMFFSSQPMERHNLEALELTMKMMKAETQLLYASDWPHQDFDLPSTIFDLPFLSDQAKRNILGETALKLFHLDRPDGK
jgi:predicted TIM-barrel fold metal-dependent hydrolase